MTWKLEDCREQTKRGTWAGYMEITHNGIHVATVMPYADDHRKRGHTPEMVIAEAEALVNRLNMGTGRYLVLAGETGAYNNSPINLCDGLEAEIRRTNVIIAEILEVEHE